METAWVIVRYVNSELLYWCGMRTGPESFVADNARAIRFAREQDAAYVLSWVFDGQGKVEEHGWDTAKAAEERG